MYSPHLKYFDETTPLRTSQYELTSVLHDDSFEMNSKNGSVPCLFTLDDSEILKKHRTLFRFRLFDKLSIQKLGQTVVHIKNSINFLGPPVDNSVHVRNFRRRSLEAAQEEENRRKATGLSPEKP